MSSIGMISRDENKENSVPAQNKRPKEWNLFAIWGQLVCDPNMCDKGPIRMCWEGRTRAEVSHKFIGRVHNNPIGLGQRSCCGVGIVWTLHRMSVVDGVPHDLLVIDAFDANSTAAEANLKRGDILAKVDGVPVIGMSIPQVAERIFGVSGTKVELTMLRGGIRGQVIITELFRQHPVLFTRANDNNRNGA